MSEFQGKVAIVTGGTSGIGRIGKSEEIADAAIWLSSNKSSFVTGHSLLVDGGFTAQ
jgi:NAD(P)-dependent dehydrogenase (short-subunit alcohol dehydrogenase family)